MRWAPHRVGAALACTAIAVTFACSGGEGHPKGDGGIGVGTGGHGAIDGAADTGACRTPTIDTSNDPWNCGEVGRVCSPVTLATGQASPVAMAIDAKNIYWVNAGTRTSLGCVALFYGGCHADSAPNPDGSVMKMPRTGGTPIVLATGQFRPESVALDHESVYWTTADASVDAGGAQAALVKVPIDGGTPARLASGPLQGPISVRSSSIYWISGDRILRVPSEGGPAATLASELSFPTTLALGEGTLYWGMSNFERTIRQMPLGGGESQVLVSLLDASVIGMVVDSRNLYFTQWYPEAVMSVRLDGGTPHMVAAGGSPGPIALTATALYWAGSFGTPPNPAILKMPLGCDSAAPAPVATEAYASALTADGAGVYWASAGSAEGDSAVTPEGTILGADGTVTRAGICTNGVCE